MERHDWMRDVCIDLAAYAHKNNLAEIDRLMCDVLVELEVLLQEYRGEAVAQYRCATGTMAAR